MCCGQELTRSRLGLGASNYLQKYPELDSRIKVALAACMNLLSGACAWFSCNNIVVCASHKAARAKVLLMYTAYVAVQMVACLLYASTNPSALVEQNLVHGA